MQTRKADSLALHGVEGACCTQTGGSLPGLLYQPLQERALGSWGQSLLHTRWYPSGEDPILILSGHGCIFSRPPGSLCAAPCHAQQSSAAHQSRIHYPPLYGVCKSDPNAHNKRRSTKQYIRAVTSPQPHTSETFPWFIGWQGQKRDGLKDTGATQCPLSLGA